MLIEGKLAKKIEGGKVAGSGGINFERGGIKRNNFWGENIGLRGSKVERDVLGKRVDEDKIFTQVS